MRRAIDELANESFDLLVMGGGITGTGVALDAIMRGIRVALIDRSDFASSTSSASSKLVHGGLRYLEHGEFKLVYEALAERRRLLLNAPHLVHPLRFVLPFYHGSRLSPWKAWAGLLLYDLLAGSHNLRGARRLTTRQLRRSFPTLRPTGLRGGAEYFDAQMDDARLCLEVARTSWVHGAKPANYVEAVGFEQVGGRITAVQARDRIDGREFVIRARQVLNATGPWVDHVNKLAGGSAEQRVQPTKGVHLVVPGDRLDAAFLFLHPRDGRVFFVIPWMGHALVGTTDTFSDEPPDKLTVTADEEAYLLEGYNHHFTVPLTPVDVMGRFAGLRPLLKSRPGDPSARSREYALFDGPGGMLCVAGGKYTTYRHMAEVITDEVARRLGVTRPCRTHDCPLDGTPAEAWETFLCVEPESIAANGIDARVARHLVGRYGRRAREVAAVLRRDPAFLESVVAGEPDVAGEFVYHTEQEMAMTPADRLLRRTRLGLFHPELLTPRGTEARSSASAALGR
jgi:glycerol-3-phosphate dehydrogenase